VSFSLFDFLSSGIIMQVTPKTFLMGWGDPEPIIQEGNSKNPCFYISDFFLTQAQPWIHYTQWQAISQQTLLQLLDNDISPIMNTCHWTTDSDSHFKQAFEELIYLFKIGVLKKAVPYLFSYARESMTHQRLQRCLKQAIVHLKQNKGYLYGYWNADFGIVGVTPELLFSHSNQQPKKIYTMALAGTCAASDCSTILIQNQKEQEEHQWVVQGICESLCTLGTLHVGNPQILKLPHLNHLMTLIEVELKQPFHFDTCVQHLHPTPALGAFPRDPGRQWLEKYQQHTPRYYYGAPLGFSYAGLAMCLVAIRNVQWNASKMFIGTGCGVVAQSVFEKERQEIQLKMTAIRTLLGI
jgi:isochorismate synthase EntC